MTTQQLLSAQYDGVKGSRQRLFEFCKSMDYADLKKPVEAFNSNNISRLLMHVANCYIHWLLMLDQQIETNYERKEDISSFDEVEDAYRHVDAILEEFIRLHRDDYDQPFTKKLPNRDIVLTTTPLDLYTHTVTHEFHHKGQIVTMSRLLGYVPVDTDVIRT